MTSKGTLFLISGPSGVGKGTICKEIFKKLDNICFSVSATTRKPRNEDAEGVTYFFKTREAFLDMIERKELLEWAEYNGNYYGTPKKFVLDKLEEGIDVILEIEVQGAMKVMENFKDGKYIFIAPPNVDELYKRLQGRGTETKEQILKRVEAAKFELQHKDKYDYVVINDELNKSVDEVVNIILKERD